MCYKSKCDYLKQELNYIYCSCTECPCHSQFVHSTLVFWMNLEGIHSWLYKQYYKEIWIYKGCNCHRDDVPLHLLLHILVLAVRRNLCYFLGALETIHKHSSNLLEYECNKHVTVRNVYANVSLYLVTLVGEFASYSHFPMLLIQGKCIKSISIWRLNMPMNARHQLYAVCTIAWKCQHILAIHVGRICKLFTQTRAYS